MTYDFYEMRQRNNEIANDMRYEGNATSVDIDKEAQCDWKSPSSYFELNNCTVSGQAPFFSYVLLKCSSTVRKNRNILKNRTIPLI